MRNLSRTLTLLPVVFFGGLGSTGSGQERGLSQSRQTTPERQRIVAQRVFVTPDASEQTKIAILADFMKVQGLSLGIVDNVTLDITQNELVKKGRVNLELMGWPRPDEKGDYHSNFRIDTKSGWYALSNTGFNLKVLYQPHAVNVGLPHLVSLTVYLTQPFSDPQGNTPNVETAVKAQALGVPGATVNLDPGLHTVHFVATPEEWSWNSVSFHVSEIPHPAKIYLKKIEIFVVK